MQEKVRVYLVKKAEKFIFHIENGIGKIMDPKSTSFCSPGVCYDPKADSWYVEWCLDAVIPKSFADLIEKITLADPRSPCLERESGTYRHKTAVADVVGYSIRITAENLEDIREFLRLFKTGNIRPIESFEGPQGGKSHAELEAENAELRQAVERLNSRIGHLEAVKARVCGEISRLISELLGKSFFTLLYRGTYNKIIAIKDIVYENK